MKARITAGTFLLLMTVAACGDRTQQSDSASAGTASTMPSGATSAAATGTLTDQNIVAILDQANAADSSLGALAATKGTDAEVKAFGSRMVADHHDLRQQGQDLATKLSVTPEPPAGDRSQAQTDSVLRHFQAMEKGPAWDRAYIDHEVAYHQQVLETARKAAAAAMNAELRALIEKAAPAIQGHLDRAKQLQTKLAG